MIMTGNTTTPVGYFVSQEACIEAAQEAFVVAHKEDDETIIPWHFLCVPVQGLMNK
jgi:hypothetical protein